MVFRDGKLEPLMLIRSFAAGPWQTNCYVVAPGPGAECVIVDPGMGASSGIAAVVADQKLKPVAVLVTHGHADHMWSVFPVASGYGIPALVHPTDRPLLADPGLAMSRETAAALPAMLGPGERFAEPDDVREVVDGMRVELAGITAVVRHAPGHTAGSVLFDMDGDTRTVLTGDVLFAGAIGRTDLPTGSPADMDDSLRRVILPLPDDALILPGHGQATRMDTERATNPYLLRVAQGLSAQ